MPDVTLTDTERAKSVTARRRPPWVRTWTQGEVESIVAARVAAAEAAARAKAAAIVESFRQQNPMNHDASNYTIDRILSRLVGTDELARLKREHQDRWNAEYLAFRARVEGADQ